MNRLLYILSFILLLGCQPKEAKVESPNNETEWVDPNSIHQGPIVHGSLTSIQTDNIKYLYNTFKEVDPTSQEKWIEDFRRDLNPDKEIEIWMMMANAYNGFCQTKDLELPVKKEVYYVALLRSSAPEDEVLKHLDLVHLSKVDAQEIMQFYTLEAKPIRVIEK